MSSHLFHYAYSDEDPVIVDDSVTISDTKTSQPIFTIDVTDADTTDLVAVTSGFSVMKTAGSSLFSVVKTATGCTSWNDYFQQGNIWSAYDRYEPVFEYCKLIIIRGTWIFLISWDMNFIDFVGHDFSWFLGAWFFLISWDMNFLDIVGHEFSWERGTWIFLISRVDRQCVFFFTILGMRPCPFGWGKFASFCLNWGISVVIVLLKDASKLRT